VRSMTVTEAELNDAVADDYRIEVEWDINSRMKVYTDLITLYVDAFFSDLRDIGVQIDGVRWLSEQNDAQFIVWFSETNEAETHSVEPDQRRGLADDEAFKEFAQVVADGELPTWKTVRLQSAVDHALDL